MRSSSAAEHPGWLQAKDSSRAGGCGQLSQVGWLGSQHPPDHHPFSPVYPRSPGMGCTVTPEAVRN